MGLFGGFKAKFTRQSRDKNAVDEVVCLKYHVLSEFEQTQFPVTVNKLLSQINKNEANKKPAIKPRKSVLTNGSFLNKTNTSKPVVPNTSQSFSSHNKPHHQQQLPDSNNVHSTTTISTKTTTENNGDIKIQTNKSILIREENPKKRQSFGSRKNSVEIVTQHKDVTESTYVEKSLLIAMIQKSDDSDSENELPPPLPSTKPPQVLPRTIFSSQQSLDKNDPETPQTSSDSSSETKPIVTFASDDDTASIKSDDDFKINIVKHDTKYLQEEYSEDETYGEDEEDFKDMEHMDFSSQAASIFFGGGDDREVSRPRRKFNFDDEDGRRSSVEC